MKKAFLALLFVFALLGRLAIAEDAAPVQTKQTVTVDASKVLRTLNPLFHGVNYTAYWDPIQGSDGARDALRRAGIKVIRFPGGVVASYYDWDDPTKKGSSSTTPEMLGKFAQGVGAKIMYQTNPTDKNDNDPSGEHLAEFVKLCKEKDIPVALWEVGNEPEIEKDRPNLIAPAPEALEWYFEKFDEHSKAIHGVDPSAVVMGPSGTNVYYWWQLNSLAMFLKDCDATADAVSLHWYGGGAATYASIMDFPQKWEANWEFIRSKTKKPVWITEWNAGGGQDNTSDETVGLALINADVIGEFAKTGVEGYQFFGCIHQVEKGWGLLTGSQDYKEPDTPAPSYFILPLWARVMGDEVLDATCTADPTKTMSVWAHKKSDDSVQVMIINKSVPQEVTVKFSGFDPTGKTIEVHELKPGAEDPDNGDVYYNGVLNPQPAKEDLPAPTKDTCNGSTYVRAVPAYSITVLNFLAGGPAPSPTPGQ